MKRDFTTAVIAILVITALFGIAYPLAVTGAAQVLFPGRADGSKVQRDGKVVGSRLIGQDFRGRSRYFQSRPSSATNYNAAGTAFTNLGPNSADARDQFRHALATYLSRERRYDSGLVAADVPVDAVTSSASGVDPHISQANAAIQAHRIAAVRRLSLARVSELVDESTDGRFLGILGEPGVNVLELNLALDREASR